VALATVCISETCRLSHCAACDAHPGECEHKGARYLHPIVYDRAVLPDGKTGFRVPEHEQARWDAAPLRVEAVPVDAESRDIEAILDDIEAIFTLDAAMEAKLRKTHERAPLRVTRLTTAFLEDAATGKLAKPSGYLGSRLQALEREQTKPL
jgi:hypothetical protein